MNLHLLLLTLCQGLFLTNNVAFIAVNGLVGLNLAPQPWMATLPVMAYVLGGALFTPLVARHQRAFGRKNAFRAGLLVAMITTALCAWAASRGSFWLLVMATLLAGYYNANAGLYRFAATELVAPAFKERAISWVLAGGILGAVAGPNLASLARGLLPVPFAGVYAVLTLVALLALMVVSFIRFPSLPVASAERPMRAMKTIMSQPIFIVAALGCALGYGVMNLLMAATPIAMMQCQHPFASAALVLQWHVLGMFVPSFFTGSLIRRVGVLPVMAAGTVLCLVCVAVALSGIDLMHFLIALFTLGVGWNFLYIGGTTLLTQAYQPEEKTSAQAALDFCVYLTMTLTSLGAGALVTTGGWPWLNAGALLPLAVIAAALAWLALMQARARASPGVVGP